MALGDYQNPQQVAHWQNLVNTPRMRWILGIQEAERARQKRLNPGAVFDPSSNPYNYTLPNFQQLATQGGQSSFRQDMANMIGGLTNPAGASASSAALGTGMSPGTGVLPGTGDTRIQTSINPSGIYSPQQTLEAVNQAVASQHMQANMPWLQSQLRRPGMSVHSPFTQRQALPSYVSALAGGRAAEAGIPFEDAIANAQHVLAGQVSRESEGQGLARLASQIGAAQRGFGTNVLMQILNLLGGV